MPPTAHQHQPSPTPLSFPAVTCIHEQKDFREYSYWKEVRIAEGRQSWSAREPGHDLKMPVRKHWGDGKSQRASAADDSHSCISEASRPRYICAQSTPNARGKSEKCV